MGVIIKGTDDTVKAADGSLSIEGFSIKTTGIGTFDGGVQVGAAATIHSTGQFNIGVAATIFANGNATFAGIVTAASYIGDGSALTGIAGTEITNSDFQVGVSTFFVDYSTGRIGINTTVPLSALDVTGDAVVSGIVTATTFVPTEGQLSNRNIIINGAMQLAQRADSSTTSGYGDVDRWQHEYASTDEAPTFAQVDVTSGDAPYLVGLTQAAKITNGNQTSGLQAASQINFMQAIEAQNIRNSGWNYKSSSSYITLSYWVRASVAQEYHGFVKTADGSNYAYPFSLGSLSANTWTKITKTIPGNSNLQIDNDSGSGFQVWPVAFYGTDYTASGVTNNAWAAWSSSERSTDQTSTWWTTNDSTFEITGVQLEVGSVDTPYEHRSYAEELYRCQRYYQRLGSPRTSIGDGGSFMTAYTQGSSNKFIGTYFFPVEMRDSPSSVEWSGTVGNYGGTCDNDGEMAATAIGNSDTRKTSGRIHLTVSSVSGGKGGLIMSKSTAAYFAWSAEL
tara:strand:+ start:804 stop:2324 length:1521 start_codon:yes stop_codon:yes gene_type:complete